jgi:hypothetical protein
LAAAEHHSMVQIPLSPDTSEPEAAQPAPTVDRYNGVPLGMEAFIPFLMTKANPG